MSWILLILLVYFGDVLGLDWQCIFGVGHTHSFVVGCMWCIGTREWISEMYMHLSLPDQVDFQGLSNLSRLRSAQCVLRTPEYVNNQKIHK